MKQKTLWRIVAKDENENEILSWIVIGTEKSRRGDGNNWQWNLKLDTEDEKPRTGGVISYLELHGPRGEFFVEHLHYTVTITPADSMKITWKKAQRVMEESGHTTLDIS